MRATSTSPTSQSAPQRRAPSQRRSRERVELILDTASDLIVEEGVPGLGTRKIAARAGVPVASIYQYFADVDEVILELVKRDTAEMDAHVAKSLTDLETLSIRSVVTTTMRAFLDVYARRPAFVEIWFRGRTNEAVLDYCREHNKQIARTIHSLVVDAGLIREGTDPLVAELAVEVGDRVWEFAFQRATEGDQRVMDEGREIVIGYVERFATPEGLAGVPVAGQPAD